MSVVFKSEYTLIAVVLFIVLIFIIYVSILVNNIDNLQSFYQNQVRSPAHGQVWSGPCGLQCITGASVGVPAPALARVCVCQTCVCDLVSGVVRPNETLEVIQGALESICDVACTQAKNVVDYVMSTDAPREVASTGILRAEVRSNLQRAYNAAPTFSERNELIPPRTDRPDKDRVQPGDLNELEDTLAKAKTKLSALTEGIKTEISVKKKEEIPSESINVDKKEPEAPGIISEIGAPSSSHASRKSHHSCAEENTVCLHECPNENRTNDDDDDDKSTKSKKEHDEVMQPNSKPKQNQAGPGSFSKLEGKLEKLAKIIVKKPSFTKSNKEKVSVKPEINTPCCQLDKDATKTKGTKQESVEPKLPDSRSVAIKEENVTKLELDTQPETAETELDDNDHTPHNELPSSSHVSTSQKSCHSCAEGNTACLSECPNLKRSDDDKTPKNTK